MSLSVAGFLAGIRNLTWKAEACTPGSLFVCLADDVGEQRFRIEQAKGRGAVRTLARLLPKSKQTADGEIHFLEHSEFQQTIAAVGAAFYKHPAKRLKLFGVTGTNGKTTTSWFLYHMLKRQFPAGLIGTIGAHYGDEFEKTFWTTPESPVLHELFSKMVQKGIGHVAMEVTSIALNELRLSSLEYQGLIFTNFTQDHLDYHRSMEDYFRAKKRFFEEYAAPDATHVFFTGDAKGEELFQMLRRSRPCRCIGLSFVPRRDPDRASVTIEREDVSGCVFHLNGPWGRRTFQTGFPANYNVLNFCLAASCLLGHGIEVSDDEDIPLPPGRLERVALPNGAHAFVDYAHTPDALFQTCQALHKVKAGGRLLLVFGCGGDRDADKRPKMGRIASEWADLIFLTTDNSRSEDGQAIINQISAGIPAGFAADHLVIQPDRRRAIEAAYRRLRPHDILCVAGKGHEQTQTDRIGTQIFSDQTVLRELAGRGSLMSDFFRLAARCFP